MRRLVIEWPWGVDAVVDRVVVGRETPAAPVLAARLESQFPNVSRQHGYLRRRAGELVLCDLGSVNGTFVNEARIDAHQEVALKAGDRIRFASRLVATVREADG
ncbi:MAG: FHA domain-containing protein [Accumulibacter sp.]|uniref:FHA domain-containing protein n=1 Tax=Accumulibacter sp. TaxID=2053492 RepID=UPI002FC36DA3